MKFSGRGGSYVGCCFLGCNTCTLLHDITLQTTNLRNKFGFMLSLRSSSNESIRENRRNCSCLFP
jgi:hypothetical protein